MTKYCLKIVSLLFRLNIGIAMNWIYASHGSVGFGSLSLVGSAPQVSRAYSEMLIATCM